MRRALFGVLAVAALACQGGRGNGAGGGAPAPGAAGGSGGGAPAESLAGLIALSSAAGSIDFAAHDEVRSDEVLSNGGVRLGTHARAAAAFEVKGAVDLDAKATLSGSVSAGETISRAPGAEVLGPAVEHAALAPIVVPGASEFLRRVAGDFGDAAPDLVVAAHRRLALPPGGRRVARLVLESGARVTVGGPSAIEVTGAIQLAPDAEIVVSTGGRLLLHASGSVELQPGARLVQETGAARNALIVVLEPGTTVDWAPNVAFGPGLLFAPDVSIAGLSSFTGALVAHDVSARVQAQLSFDASYLQCPSAHGVPSVTLAHPNGAETAVRPGTSQVTLAGSVSRDTPLDALVVTDALGTTAVAALPGGAFSATARLRADGEPTMVCVVARSCGGQEASECRLITVRHELELALTTPLPGSVLPSGPVNVIGRVRGAGTPAQVRVGSTIGSFHLPGFYVTGVPATPGLNVLRVVATSASGDVVSVPLVFGIGSMPVKVLELRVDASRRVTVVSRSTATTSRDLALEGQLVYRLLDASGAELFGGKVPGTAQFRQDVLDAAGQLHAVSSPAPAYHATVVAPAVPGATQIELVDEAGRRVGLEAF